MVGQQVVDRHTVLVVRSSFIVPILRMFIGTRTTESGHFPW